MLDAARAEIGELRQSRSSPMTDAEAKKLLGAVDEVVVAKGKKTRVLAAKEATLDDLRGPTGNIRAPLLRFGRRLLVGFSEEALKAELKK